jgi:hypothetical protein
VASRILFANPEYCNREEVAAGLKNKIPADRQNCDAQIDWPIAAVPTCVDPGRPSRYETTYYSDYMIRYQARTYSTPEQDGMNLFRGMIKPAAGYPLLAYSSPEAVQTTGTAALLASVPANTPEGGSA